MSDEDSEIEEEYLIYAELCDNTDPNIFHHAESSFSSFALDSDQPILIIGGQAFVGTYKDTVGTAVFLEETSPDDEESIGVENEPPDPLFVTTSTKRLQYVAHTRKTLEMSRVLLIEKNKVNDKSVESNSGIKCLEETFQEVENNPFDNEVIDDQPSIKDENSETLHEGYVDIDENVSFSYTGFENQDTETWMDSNSSHLVEENHISESIEQIKIHESEGMEN